MRRPAFAILAIALLWAERPLAAERKTLLRRIADYGREVSRVEASAVPVSLEPLLERGSGLAAELKPILEQLPAREYEQVVRHMKGFVVSREEVILAEPDARWFAALARRVGTEPDRIYFDFMRKVAPEGYWPIYVVRQTDLGGCTNYGAGTLSSLYAEGRAAASRLGRHYRREVEKTLGDIAKQLTAGTCACGDLASVVRELRTFLEASPDAALAAAVRTRLATIERGEPVLTTGCVGGR